MYTTPQLGLSKWFAQKRNGPPVSRMTFSWGRSLRARFAAGRAPAHQVTHCAPATPELPPAEASELFSYFLTRTSSRAVFRYCVTLTESFPDPSSRNLPYKGIVLPASVSHAGAAKLVEQRDTESQVIRAEASAKAFASGSQLSAIIGLSPPLCSRASADTPHGRSVRSACFPPSGRGYHAFQRPIM
jgi:hypothetical protein